MHRTSALLGLLISLRGSQALTLDLNDPTSIKNASKTIVSNIVSLYQNSPIPGEFPLPYYWWEAGLAFDSLVNYWAVTGDDSYVNLTRDALSFQVGPDYNYMPPNQTKDEGNDDQSYWALAAMTAAERRFPAPTGNVSWLQLAQNVFNDQVARWDTATCAGGLRWQIFPFNAGYSYKNSFSNANLAQLAARLARYTGNQTYSDWALKTINWSQEVGLITSAGNVYDGTSATTNCSDIDHVQWTANFGSVIATAAFLSNLTDSNPSWTTLLDSTFLTANSIFTKNGVLFESACAPSNNCDVDQLSFRAILARGLVNANTLTAGSSVTSNNTSPSQLHSLINSVIQKSATGAALQCSGGSNATLCGSNWSTVKWDGTSGLGQDLSALEVILANLPAAQLATANTANLTSTSTTTGTGAQTSSSPAGSSSAVHSSPHNSASDLMAPVLFPLLGLGLAAML